MDLTTRGRWAGLGLLVAALIVYGRAAGGAPLDWDDPVWFGDPIRSQDPVTAVVTAFTTVRDNVWAPIFRLSFAGWLALAQGQVATLHALELTLFLGSSVGLFALLRRFEVSERAAGVAMAAWMLHPTKVEAVAWLTALKDVESLAWLVGGALVLVPREGQPGVRQIAGGTALVGLALLTKAAVFPLVFVLGAALTIRHGRAESLRRCGPSFALAIAAAGIGAAVWRGPDEAPPFSPLVQAAWVHGAFWSRLLPQPGAAIVAPPVSPWLAVALGLLGTGAWLWVARSSAVGRVTWLLWALPQLPFLGAATMAFWASDRHLMVASLGPLLWLGFAADRFPRAIGPLVAAWLLVSAGISARRVGDWRDSRALWEAEVLLPGQHWARWAKVGHARAVDGDFADAATAFSRSLELRPEQPATLARLVIAELAADGWTRADAELARRFEPPPSDWAAASASLRAAGETALADRVEATVRAW